jgi:HAD superfamily hydrolase (TIGR01509 family)
MFKAYIENKKAVFFDLDGTVVKTYPLLEQAFAKVLKEIDAEWVYLPTVREEGEPIIETWHKILRIETIKTKFTAKELTEHLHNEYLKIIKKSELNPTPGFWSLAYELKVEKGFKLALVTNSNRVITTAVLNQMGINQTFDFIICGDEVKNKKPDPEMFLTAAKQVGASHKEVLVFEDSLIGAVAATKARMSTIIIWDGETDQRSYPKDILAFLPDFTMLPQNLDKTYIEAFQDAIKPYIEKRQKKITPQTAS